MKTVLVLEDKREINNTLYRCLKMSNYHVIQCFNYKDVETIIKQQTIDCIIVDEHMFEMNMLNQNIDIILLTTRKSTNIDKCIIQLEKPLYFDKLIEILKIL